MLSFTVPAITILTGSPGSRFIKNLQSAITMQDKQQDNYVKLSATFPKEVLTEWEEMIKAWNMDKSSPNPYEEAQHRKSYLGPFGHLF